MLHSNERGQSGACATTAHTTGYEPNLIPLQSLAAHKTCVKSVTLHVHSRARCDAHLTLHVAHVTHARCVAILAKAASAFFSAEPPASAKWLWWSIARAELCSMVYRCTYSSGAHWDHRSEARDTAGGPGRYTNSGHGVRSHRSGRCGSFLERREAGAGGSGAESSVKQR